MPSKPLIQFRASELKDGLESRTHPDENASAVARLIVGQYLHLMTALDAVTARADHDAEEGDIEDVVLTYWYEDKDRRGTVAEAKKTV